MDDPHLTCVRATYVKVRGRTRDRPETNKTTSQITKSRRCHEPLLKHVPPVRTLDHTSLRPSTLDACLVALWQSPHTRRFLKIVSDFPSQSAAPHTPAQAAPSARTAAVWRVSITPACSRAAPRSRSLAPSVNPFTLNATRWTSKS